MEHTEEAQRYTDLTGRKYGRLTVLEKSNRQYYGTQWVCRCRCGNITEVRADNLQGKHTRSCGCLTSDQSRVNISLVRR